MNLSLPMCTSNWSSLRVISCLQCHLMYLVTVISDVCVLSFIAILEIFQSGLTRRQSTLHTEDHGNDSRAWHPVSVSEWLSGAHRRSWECGVHLKEILGWDYSSVIERLHASQKPWVPSSVTHARTHAHAHACTHAHSKQMFNK